MSMSSPVRPRTRRAGDTRAAAADRSFANRSWRNALQAAIEIPLLVRLLRVPSDSAILELGCGQGVGLTALARECRPASLIAIDIDGELLRSARARIDSRNVVAGLARGDIRALPFRDEAFDVVIDFGTIYHVEPAADVLAEVTRVLRVGGVFVHETPLSQLLAHPRRSSRQPLQWRLVPCLAPQRSAGLWKSRVKLPETWAASGR